jgi:macrolide-specific efflux system membrane fusion protein
VARLVLRQKEAELESARIKLARHQLVAPFAGMVVEINKERGEWVNPGDAVLRLVRLDRLRAQAFVPSREFAAHQQGRPIALFVELPHKGRVRFNATIVFVSPEVNPVNGQVLIWAEVDNKSLALRPGQAATLEIEPASSVVSSSNAE